MEILNHSGNTDIQKILDYKNYDFENNKPDPSLNAHFVPIYLFFKIAKDLDCSINSESENTHSNFSFETKKSKEMFAVWFSLDKAGPLKTFLTISWTAGGIIGDVFITLRGQITETKGVLPEIELDLNRTQLSSSLQFLNSGNHIYGHKNNRTIMFYYEKLISEIKLLIETNA